MNPDAWSEEILIEISRIQRKVMDMPKVQIVKKARPNGWGIKMEQWSEGDEATFAVYEEDEEGYFDDGIEFDEDRAKAEAYFDERVAELQDTPNWRLQEEYDEAHGTVNGYDPDIEAWKNESGEY